MFLVHRMLVTEWYELKQKTGMTYSKSKLRHGRTNLLAEKQLDSITFVQNFKFLSEQGPLSLGWHELSKRG